MSEVLDNITNDENVENAENIDVAANIIDIPEKKKRGRKPKNQGQLPIQPVIEKEVKRRGRRPTCKIYEDQQIDNMKIENIQHDECIIVHLPITKKDIDMLKINVSANSNNKNQNFGTKILDDFNDFSDYTQRKNIEDKAVAVNAVNAGKERDKVREAKELHSMCLIDSCTNCAVLDKKVKDLEVKLLLTKIVGNDKKKLTTNIRLEDIYSGKNLWEYDNKICCRWCLHKFDTLPIGIPESYDVVTNAYCVFGFYCSFNCALSHNLTLTGHNMHNRISLLYHMRNNIFYYLMKEIDEKMLGPIIPAPPQDMLYMFGGPLSIEEFRASSILFKKQYIQYAPNVFTIDKVFEENTLANKNKPKNKTNDLVLMRPKM